MVNLCILDPNIRSTKARDRSVSGMAFDIKEARDEYLAFDKHHALVGIEKLHILVVKNKSYKEQKRKSNYGGNDLGKPKGVGLPTGGSETQEATENIAIRETFNETGYKVKRIILLLSEFRVIKSSRHAHEKKPHPHYPYLIDAETSLVENIKEKSEIEWARYIPFCEVIERLKLCKKTQREFEDSRGVQHVDPEAFYFSHAKYFIMPFFFRVYNMMPEEIATGENPHYREWLTKFRPHIVNEINEHGAEIDELGLIPTKYFIMDDGEKPQIEVSESVSI